MVSHIALEIVLLLLGAFVIGCILGCIAHSNWTLFFSGSAEAIEPAPETAERPAVQAAEEPALTGVAAPPTPVEARESISPDKPAGLDAPRAGGADDLKRIKGIGPVLEKKLNALGYYHFDQIAEWSADNVAWVDDHMNFKGRIERDDWIAQAQDLAGAD